MNEKDLIKTAIQYIKKPQSPKKIDSMFFRRRFQIGEARAQKLLKELEKNGIVSKEINGKRTVLANN